MKRGPMPVTLALARKLVLTRRRCATSVVVRRMSALVISLYVLLSRRIAVDGSYAKRCLGACDKTRQDFDEFCRGIPELLKALDSPRTRGQAVRPCSAREETLDLVDKVRERRGRIVVEPVAGRAHPDSELAGGLSHQLYKRPIEIQGIGDPFLVAFRPGLF